MRAGLLANRRRVRAPPSTTRRLPLGLRTRVPTRSRLRASWARSPSRPERCERFERVLVHARTFVTMRILPRLSRWLFTDRSNGRIVVAQWPNLALWIFLAMLGISTVIRQGAAGKFVHVVGLASLVAWAFDEIARGVNPWRRLLGGTILLWLCARGVLALAHHR